MIALLLSWARPWLLPVVGLLVAGLALRGCTAEAGRRAVAQYEAAVARRAVDSLRTVATDQDRRIAALTAQLQARVTRLEVVRVVHDTAAARLLRDTLVVHDTTYVPIAPVRQLIATAAEERRACSEALGTCGALGVAKDARIHTDSLTMAAQAGRIAALEADRPSRWAVWGERVAIGGASLVACSLGARF